MRRRGAAARRRAAKPRLRDAAAAQPRALPSFPAFPRSTLQWARDWFEGEFKSVPDAVNAYLSAPDFLAAQARQLPAVRIKALEDIGCALGSERPSSVEDCVRWARLKFEALFVHDIKQLLHNFPPGAAGAHAGTGTAAAVAAKKAASWRAPSLRP